MTNGRRSTWGATILDRGERSSRRSAGTPVAPLRRCTTLGAIAAAGLAAVPPLLRAQERFASRPIRLIVPFAAGGISDIMAWLVGKALSEQLRQPVNIGNRPGGGTVIGTQEAIRARPDGYTILLVSAPIATNPGLFPKLP